MGGITVIFWVILWGIAYAYLLYPLLLLVITPFFKKKIFFELSTDNLPEVTLFVTAFNEEDFVDQKIKNSYNLNYPQTKLKLVWVTDGSTDNTNIKLSAYRDVTVYFEPERRGKISAMNRGMQFVSSDIVVFSDGNTLLDSNVIIEMVKLFQDKKVACVAGEKRILVSDKDDAAAAGEGLYWKYESWIKKHDAIVGSTIGAAGELFAIRRELFQAVESDTILDDFIISLRLAMQGYKIDYSTNAFATERASANVNEEMKRKVRIAAGSIQAIVRLKALFNIFKYKGLSFQYLSHKVLRWIFVPLFLPVLLILNFILFVNSSDFTIYTLVFFLQLWMYLFILIGFILKNIDIRQKWLFVPYYFFIANLAMWLGFFKYLSGKQSVNWERAQRAVQ